MPDEQRAIDDPRRSPVPGEGPQRAWSTKDDDDRPADSKPKGSLWDRFLHLMGIVGTDRRGGPGG